MFSISDLIEVDGTLKVNASKTTQSEHDNIPYKLNAWGMGLFF